MTHSSRAADQAKTEPFPAQPAESEAETPGDGGSAPRAASTAVSGDPASVPQPGTEASPGTSEELPVVQGLHTPDVPETDPRS